MIPDEVCFSWRSRSVFIGPDVRIICFAARYPDALVTARITSLYFYDQDLLQMEAEDG